MKRIISIILSLILASGLIACGKNEKNVVESVAEKVETELYQTIRDKSELDEFIKKYQLNEEYSADKVAEISIYYIVSDIYDVENSFDNIGEMERSSTFVYPGGKIKDSLVLGYVVKCEKEILSEYIKAGTGFDVSEELDIKLDHAVEVSKEITAATCEIRVAYDCVDLTIDGVRVAVERPVGVVAITYVDSMKGATDQRKPKED